MRNRSIRRLTSIFLLTLSACAANEKHVETYAETRARQLAVDASPPDCRTRNESRTIDDIALRFPNELKTWGSANEIFVELLPGAAESRIFGNAEAIKLIKRDLYRDATAIMTDAFPAWSNGDYTARLSGKTVAYKRVVMPEVFKTGLDLLAPTEALPAPHNLYFLEATTDRVSTLITCPFVPTAVAPMMWCTLSKSNNASIGYKVNFQAADLERWRDVEALAQDIIADAMTCGKS